MLVQLKMPTLNAPRIPSDPVIVRAQLHTQYSEAGRQLKQALQDFFERPQAPFRLNNVTESSYKDLRRDLEELRKLREGGQVR